MKLRKYLYILIAIIVTVVSINTVDAYAASRSKSRTSQQSKSKSKSNKSSSSKSKRSKSKKKSSRNKKNKTSSRSVRRVQRVVTPPPVETASNDSLTLSVNDAVLRWIPSNLNPGGLRINSVKTDRNARTAKISLNENFTYLPVTKEFIDSLSRHISLALPDSLSDMHVTLNVGQRNLAYYITKVDKLPEKFRKNPPFVTEVRPFVNPVNGLPNDIIALWHSHGRYFRNGYWAWQRGYLFQSLEDTYTMSYILQYVVPMLENAGAYVMLPRERDLSRHEVIVDNDINPGGAIFSQPYYKEVNGKTEWTTGEEDGFIYDLPDFRDTENPFENGTYRQTATIKNGKPSLAAWYADIPEDGEYAVYISYKTLPNSSEDVHYTVNYSGGSKEFIVNQTMGGGTWIYLGTFPLRKGYSDSEPIVTLSNLSDKGEGLVVTADAVKIGGGMGNIARSSRRADVFFDPSTPEQDDDSGDDADDEEDDSDEDDATTDDQATEDVADDTVEESETGEIVTVKKEETKKEETKKEETPTRTAPTFRTSGLPRYLEGARYWMHWAGIPEEVYSPFHGNDDYKDDYTARGHWVNYLAGGSRVLPNREGLNLPVDLSFALHTDAGKRADDSTVGTLGIYFTNYGSSYTDGTPRINSRMLTDIVMRQITNDIRQQHEPSWTRRSMWDKSYLEARVAEVPTTLIELLSHQNFGDMQYGLDPDFQFTVGRAIYKGLARFLADRKDRELIIQPLPAKNFAIKRLRKNQYRLSWEPTPDPLEPTAMPDKYIILERTEGDMGFHKIAETNEPKFELKVNDNKIHSFRIIAANKGGISFPSETLALRESENGEQPALIVNGFTRVSAPAHFADGNRAGFDAENDFGVPYIKNISFTGYQSEYNRSAGNSFGVSGSNYVDKIIAGNTFDYPALHGAAFADNERGFVSSSVGAVENGDVKLTDYKLVDLILGKQKATTMGRGVKGVRYRAYSPELQQALNSYAGKGGNLIVSGEYAVSDLYDRDFEKQGEQFAANTLGVAQLTMPVDTVTGVAPTPPRSRSGKMRDAAGRTVDYSSTLNEKCYIVEHATPLVAAEGEEAREILSLSDTGRAAGLLIEPRNNRHGRNFIMTIPFESITSSADRSRILGEILKQMKQ